MKKRIINFFVTIYLSLSLSSNALAVPCIKVRNKMKFAGVNIRMARSVTIRIQQKVDQLCKWNHDKMVEKANLFFPVFKKILTKEQVPQDLKFLAMHESELILDRISETKDVGIWQFHPVAIDEVGLKVNSLVDERKHLIYSTYAMAKKMKINYVFFNNWINTILAYNMGRTGAQNYISKHGKSYARKVTTKYIYLGKNTPNYIVYVLAYKWAFKNYVGGNHSTYKLHIHKVKKCKSFFDVSKKFNIDHNLIKEYNPWLKCPKLLIPNDKKHSIIVPLLLSGKSYKTSRKKDLLEKTSIKPIKPVSKAFTIYKEKNKLYPKIEDPKEDKIITINGLKGIKPSQSMSIKQIAEKGNISSKQFKIYNDINNDHKIIPKQVYYFEQKKSKAKIKYHIADKDDTWWKIAQQYGIVLKDLLIKNERTDKVASQQISLNRLIYLKFIRPKYYPIKYVK